MSNEHTVLKSFTRVNQSTYINDEMKNNCERNTSPCTSMLIQYVLGVHMEGAFQCSGFESVSQRYVSRSGFLYYQANIVRKT